MGIDDSIASRKKNQRIVWRQIFVIQDIGNRVPILLMRRRDKIFFSDADANGLTERQAKQDKLE